MRRLLAAFVLFSMSSIAVAHKGRPKVVRV
jgi:hypothetical protein